MKKILFLSLLVLSLAISALAQTNPAGGGVLDGVYVKERNLTRQPLNYTYLRESDVMWDKRIWRIIDINEKMNLPFKFPQSSYPIKDRQNLADVLFDAFKEGGISAYSFQDDEFVLPMTYAEIAKQGGERQDTQRLQRPDPPYDEYDTVIAKSFNRDDIFGWKVKEEWFFDKQRSVMDVRIIGVAPLVYAKDEQGNIRESHDIKTLCWFYFPECRPLLAQKEVFNRGNTAQRMSFDDIFHKRFFNSYIIKEDNVYDRKIADYKTGLGQIVESDRIKNEISNLEHDMWEY